VPFDDAFKFCQGARFVDNLGKDAPHTDFEKIDDVPIEDKFDWSLLGGLITPVVEKFGEPSVLRKVVKGVWPPLLMPFAKM
jgi:hypothetical protein